MKRIILILLTIVQYSLFTQDYGQEVHQYTCREAWELLKNSNPSVYNNIEMKNWIGNNSTLGPWTFADQQRVVAGAHREDDEDVLYDYYCWFTYTNAHFWKTWNPYLPTHFTPYEVGDCGATCGSNYNAWNRLEKYIKGGWELKKSYSGNGNVTFQRWDNQGNYVISNPIKIAFVYEGLVEGPQNLYQYKFMKITKAQFANNYWHYYDPPLEVRLIDDQEKYFCYEILGRMAHLIGDLSVPAHTKLDAHPHEEVICEKGDSYEMKMNTWYNNYTASNTERFINPLFQTEFDPIYYLAFLTLQVSGRFPSNDFEPYPFVWQYHPFEIVGTILIGSPNYTRSIFTGYGTSGLDGTKFNNIATYCMKTALRTIAGLFYWFAYKTGQVPWDPYNPAPGNITITSNLPYNSQNNEYTLYKGVNGTLTASSNNATTYYWQYKLCGQGCQSCWVYDPLPQYGLIMPPFNHNWGQHMSIYNESFYGYSCPGDVPTNLFLQWKVTANNNSGSNFLQGFKVQPKSTNIAGGCPWIYVDTDSGTHAENNIFHRSEFIDFAGMDIKDLYKIQNKPRFENGVTTIQINETDKDLTLLDNVKFYAVDHPVGTNVGITENNDIVLYYPGTIESSDEALLNNISIITSHIQYNAGTRLDVYGYSNDSIYAHYDSSSQMNKRKSLSYNLLFDSFIDSLALIGLLGHNNERIYPANQNKDYAGNIVINTDNDSYTEMFARREMSSEVIIPFSGVSDVVNDIKVNWTNDYELAYLSVVPVSYYGYSISELELIEATHNLSGDILEHLSHIDNIYINIDTLSLVTLRFFENNQPQPEHIRDYLIEFNGHYLTLNGSTRISSRQSNLTNTSPNKFELFNNYPNPFNPKTVIKYSIPLSNIVTLKVYDITGRLVETLVNEYKEAGIYLNEFDGTNIASGVYFYILQSGDFIQSKKMVILK